jgi:hypothetical protein
MVVGVGAGSCVSEIWWEVHFVGVVGVMHWIPAWHAASAPAGSAAGCATSTAPHAGTGVGALLAHVDGAGTRHSRIGWVQHVLGTATSADVLLLLMCCCPAGVHSAQPAWWLAQARDWRGWPEQRVAVRVMLLAATG